MNRTLKSLRLGNFKAFGEMQEIPIRPITLIFGPNSSGKSSIIHSMALAHEASQRGELDVFKTELGGSSIDLGGFRQYVFRRDSTKNIEFSWTLDVAGLPNRLQEIVGAASVVSVTATYGIAIDLDDLLTKDENGNVTANPVPTRPELISYELLGDDKMIVRMSRRRKGVLAVDRIELQHPIVRRLISTLLESYTFTLTVSEADQEVITEVFDELVPRLRSEGQSFLPENIIVREIDGEDEEDEATVRAAGSPSASEAVLATDRLSQIDSSIRLYMPRLLGELVGKLSAAIYSELGQLQYLGPLRSYPPRHVAFSDTDDPNWRAGGGFAWDVLRRDTTVREVVNAWLNDTQKLSTPYELIVEDLLSKSDLEDDYNQVIEDIEQLHVNGEIDDLFGQIYSALDTSCSGNTAVQEVNLYDRRTNTKVSHRDVGIGISQVLPVLVAAYGSDNSLIAIEQPEIHVHPKLQAELGDVFIDTAVSGGKNTFVLETHSEHLILRILRRVREKKISASDVAVLYVEPLRGRGSRVKRIEIDDEGDFIDDWPGGFFEESFKEKFAGR